MKLISYACFSIILFAACHSTEQKTADVKMEPKTINPAPVVHDSLNAAQMEKVKQIQKTFAGVFPESLEETIADFKQDPNPDKEIATWLNMASAYEKYIHKYPGADSAKKQEAFQLVLLRSMMPDQEAVNEAKLKVLSPEEVNDLLRNYGAEAAPVTTR